MIVFDPQTLVGCQFIHGGNRSEVFTIKRFSPSNEGYGEYSVCDSNGTTYRDRLTNIIFNTDEDDFIDENGLDFVISWNDVKNFIKDKDPQGDWFFIKKPSFDSKFKKHLEVIRNTQ